MILFDSYRGIIMPFSPYFHKSLNYQHFIGFKPEIFTQFYVELYNIFNKTCGIPASLLTPFFISRILIQKEKAPNGASSIRKSKL